MAARRPLPSITIIRVLFTVCHRADSAVLFESKLKMTMPGFMEKSGHSLWSGAFAVVVGATLGFLSQSYFNQGRDNHEYNQSVEERLHADDIAIDALKITVTALGVEVKGTESSISEILASQNSNAATLQILKDSDEARKEQMNEIKQQLSTITDYFRPPRAVLPRN